MYALHAEPRWRSNVELRQIRYLLEVARRGGFTRAGESLQVAQSALSVAVRRLEEELGLKLIDRTRRGAALTSEGRTFLQRAALVERQVHDLELEMGELRGLARGEVRVGIPAMLATYAFPPVVAAFRERHPGLRLSVRAGGAQSIQRGVAAGELDVGVVARQGIEESLVFRSLLRDEVVVCVGHGHPLAAKESVRIEDLAEEPLLLFREGFLQRAVLEEAFAARRLVPRVALETDLVSLLVDEAARGAGVTTLLRMAARAEPRLAALSLRPRVHVEAGVAWRSGAYLSKAARAFIDFVAAAELWGRSARATPRSSRP
jgi:DNA-binding transcriptional LysR family regulator